MPTQKQKTPTKTDKPSIPTAGDGTPTKKLSLAARFAKKSRPTTTTIKKEDRAQMSIPAELAKRYAEYAPTKAIFDLFDSRNKTEKRGLNEDLWTEWIKLLWSKKSQPQNPKIVVKNENGEVDCEGMFQITTGSKIKINMPPVGDDEEPDEVFVAALIDLGVEAQDAIDLVEREVDFIPIWNVNLTTLMHGAFGGDFSPATDDDKSGGEPLFLALMGENEEGEELDAAGRAEVLASIPEEGWSAIQEHINGHTKCGVQLVDPGSFLDRVCGYAHSEDQLASILSMITPLYFMTRTKAFVSDDPAAKVDRLISEAATRLGADLGVAD